MGRKVMLVDFRKIRVDKISLVRRSEQQHRQSLSKAKWFLAASWRWHHCIRSKMCMCLTCCKHVVEAFSALVGIWARKTCLTISREIEIHFYTAYNLKRRWAGTEQSVVILGLGYGIIVGFDRQVISSDQSHDSIQSCMFETPFEFFSRTPILK